MLCLLLSLFDEVSDNDMFCGKLIDDESESMVEGDLIRDQIRQDKLVEKHVC